MNDQAIHLAEHVLPEVPVRQWVLSMPMQVRWHLARDGKLKREVLQIVIDGIGRWYRRRLGRSDGRWGSATCVQRWGGAINLNAHFHILGIDGLYVPGEPGGSPKFLGCEGPEPEELSDLVWAMREKILDHLVKRKVLEERESEEIEQSYCALIFPWQGVDYGLVAHNGGVPAFVSRKGAKGIFCWLYVDDAITLVVERTQTFLEGVGTDWKS